MNVKELFQSLELKDIIEPMKKKYPTALLPISEYKEDYAIILNTEFSGEGGTITFRPDGKSDRIDYIEDLLLNPLYNSKKYLSPDKKQECICVLYTTPEHPCTAAEQNRITKILSNYFGTTPWQLFTRQCKGLDNEAELDITYITQ